MRLEQIFRRLNEPALIRGQEHRQLRDLAISFVERGKLERAYDDDDDDRPRRQSAPQQRGPVRDFMIHGVMLNRASGFDEACFGALSMERINYAIREATDDPSVKLIRCWFDTPGGMVAGTPELGETLLRASQAKETRAVVSGLCCSAGYWVASQCREVISDVSSKIGSVGVYTAWIDDSEQMKNEGLRWEVIQSGKYKTMGLTGPLTKEEREMVQAQVTQTHELFKDTIIKVRPGMDRGDMEGQVFSASDALERGFVDAVTLDLPGYLQGDERKVLAAA
jgi:signal peptide peptidase SppA